MKIGVFITTHLNDSSHGNYRHGNGFAERVIDRFKKVVQKYKTLDSGVNDVTYIIDTGSDLPEYLDFMKDCDGVNWQQIPNVGGGFASLKYVMHTAPDLMDEFDYFLFHTDDGVFVKGDGWGTQLIEDYHSTIPTNGIMGRQVDTLVFGPRGIEWDDGRIQPVAPHIAEVWNLTVPTPIEVLHADWYFMNRETIQKLSAVWYDAIHSSNAMKYQETLENTNYVTLATLSDNRKTLDDFHIGRELDVGSRVKHYGMNIATYTGNNVITSPSIPE
jgi:hypothetical protein